MVEEKRVMVTEVTTVRLACPHCGNEFWDPYTNSYYLGEDGYNDLLDEPYSDRKKGHIYCTECGGNSLPLRRRPYRKYKAAQAEQQRVAQERQA